METSTSDPAKDIVEAARKADIPVIFFNREVADNDVINSYEKCAFVGTNAPDAGHMQGEMIGNYVLANYDAIDLNGDGKISYVMFKGQEANAEAEARTQFGVEDADKVLTAAGKPALEYSPAPPPSTWWTPPASGPLRPPTTTWSPCWAPTTRTTTT